MSRRFLTNTIITPAMLTTKKPQYRHMFFDLNNPDIYPILNTLDGERYKTAKKKSNNRLHKIEMHESHSAKPFIFTPLKI